MDKFWLHVEVGHAKDCWQWVGPRDRDGYGRCTVSHKTRRPSHRIAYALEKGAIPEGMVVMHSCDNPGCCNPSHLSVGTQADNVRDCKAKGRARGGRLAGEASPNAKLTAVEVLAIRRDARRHNEIARYYGISYSLVGHIRSGRAWKHLGA